jgi:hypothetical protein
MDNLWFGLVGVAIGSLPLWYKMFSERREIDAKIKNLDANTDKTAVESLRIALDEMNDRLTSLKREVQRNVIRFWHIIYSKRFRISWRRNRWI